jgi:hypothetical protein
VNIINSKGIHVGSLISSAVFDLRGQKLYELMDLVFSFLISAGIIAFGVWVVAGTIAAGWPWTLMGLLAVTVGVLSLYESVRTPRHGVFEGPRVKSVTVPVLVN